MINIPIASDVQAPQEVETQQEVVAGAPLEAVLAALKGLESAELFKVMKQALAEAEKRSKAVVAPKKGATKKTGSMPKGVVPPQLRKPRAWVDFTLKHSLEHGWEAFTVYQSKKDKTTGEKVEEEIEMPCSELLNGANVYKGSVDEKHPAGKQLIHKDAMSLSKQRWAPKEKAGTHHALYQEFESTYVEEVTATSDSDSEKKAIVRKTVAEKEAEAEANKVAKEAEKEAKKAEKEAEKAAKKAEKAAEAETKKAEKAAEAEAKKVAKKASTVVPAAAVKKVEAVTTPVVKAATKPVVKAVTKPVVKAVVKAVTKPVAKKEELSCPADGMVHPWSYKGKQYLRNSDNEVWLKGDDGGCGEWQGMFKPTEDRIDDSVAEPVFADE
jgi:hypothetical protein